MVINPQEPATLRFLFCFHLLSLSSRKSPALASLLLTTDLPSIIIYHQQPHRHLHFSVSTSPSPSFSSSEQQHPRHHQILLQWFQSWLCSYGYCGYSCCQHRYCLLLHYQHDEAADHRLSFSPSSSFSSSPRRSYPVLVRFIACCCLLFLHQ